MCESACMFLWSISGRILRNWVMGLRRKGPIYSSLHNPWSHTFFQWGNFILKKEKNINDDLFTKKEKESALIKEKLLTKESLHWTLKLAADRKTLCAHWKKRSTVKERNLTEVWVMFNTIRDLLITGFWKYPPYLQSKIAETSIFRFKHCLLFLKYLTTNWIYIILAYKAIERIQLVFKFPSPGVSLWWFHFFKLGLKNNTVRNFHIFTSQNLTTTTQSNTN